MRASRIRSPLSLLPRTKPIWPEPEASIGLPRGIAKGRYSYWEAIGPALERYETIGEEIQQTLHTSLGQVPASTILSLNLYMIGRTPATAVPHIMFGCNQSEPRKRAMAVIRKSGILDRRAPGMELGHWKCPPHILDPEPLASYYSLENTDAEDKPASYCTRSVFDSKCPSIVLAMQLGQTRSSSDGAMSLKTATIGAVVQVFGKDYYVAPEHFFTTPDTTEQTLPSYIVEMEDENECEFGAFSSEDEVSDEEVDFMSQYSLSPAASDVGSDAESYYEDASDEELEEPSFHFSIPKMEPLPRPSHQPQSLPSDSLLEIGSMEEVAKEPAIASKDLDYVLIEREDFDGYMCRLPKLTRRSVRTVPSGETKVRTVTGSGRHLQGTLSGTPSYTRVPGSKSFQKTFIVEFDGPLLPGDSGSVVRDSKTGLVYGHIIAGSVAARVAYIMPSSAVLADLEAFKAKNNPQIHVDTPDGLFAWSTPQSCLPAATDNGIHESAVSWSPVDLDTGETPIPKAAKKYPTDRESADTEALLIHSEKPGGNYLGNFSRTFKILNPSFDFWKQNGQDPGMQCAMSTISGSGFHPRNIQIRGTMSAQIQDDRLKYYADLTQAYEPEVGDTLLAAERHTKISPVPTSSNQEPQMKTTYRCRCCKGSSYRSRGTLKRHVQNLHTYGTDKRSTPQLSWRTAFGSENIGYLCALPDLDKPAAHTLIDRDVSIEDAPEAPDERVPMARYSVSLDLSEVHGTPWNQETHIGGSIHVSASDHRQCDMEDGDCDALLCAVQTGTSEHVIRVLIGAEPLTKHDDAHASPDKGLSPILTVPSLEVVTRIDFPLWDGWTLDDFWLDIIMLMVCALCPMRLQEKCSHCCPSRPYPRELATLKCLFTALTCHNCGKLKGCSLLNWK
ncbi:hypothetical protein BJY01DRAFT_216257 [Aspergillus pseudoustus]|uniref:C2H2-type domain-containing protein n=1 Tax=Aspergillus pseudoustus TaxID=1810923 RepID=A0ABR4JSD8_9EURO